MGERLVWWLEEGTEACRFCGAPPSAAEEDIEARTKDELYERARELEIPGRSGMTKDELAHPTRRAS